LHHKKRGAGRPLFDFAPHILATIVTENAKFSPIDTASFGDIIRIKGGVTLGLKLVGFEVVEVVEIDSLDIETYQSNHQDVPVWFKLQIF